MIRYGILGAANIARSFTRGLAGSTILGSGEVALILDVPALLHLATGRLSHSHPRPAAPLAAAPATAPALPQ